MFCLAGVPLSIFITEIKAERKGGVKSVLYFAFDFSGKFSGVRLTPDGTPEWLCSVSSWTCALSYFPSFHTQEAWLGEKRKGTQEVW